MGYQATFYYGSKHSSLAEANQFGSAQAHLIHALSPVASRKAASSIEMVILPHPNDLPNDLDLDLDLDLNIDLDFRHNDH